MKSDYFPPRLLKATVDTVEKNFTVAEQELTALAKEQPDNPIVARQMAAYYDSRGNRTDAEKSLVRALELKPDSTELLREVTLLFYLRSRQFDKAVQRINAIPDNRKQAVHYELLGLAYSQGGKPAEAESAFKHSLALDPSRPDADAYLFANYMQAGRVDEGIKYLDEAIKKDPKNAAAYGIKAQIYQSQGKVDEAKQYYLEALKVNPGAEGAANNLAYILAEQGTDLQTALTYPQLARKKQSENPTIAGYAWLGLLQIGDYVLAGAQLQFAISKQPDNGVYQYHLGMIYKANRQVTEAQNILRKAANSTKDFKEKSLARSALKEIEVKR